MDLAKISGTKTNHMEINEKDWLTRISEFLPAATSVSLAVTGLMYFSGYSSREIFLNSVGLSITHFSDPIQITIANGFLPLTCAAAALGILHIMSSVTQVMHKNIKRQRNNPISLNDSDARNTVSAAFKKMDKFLDRIVIINKYNLMLVAVLISIVCGSFFGKFNSNQLRDTVRNGCTTCFKYNTDRKWIVGVLVGDDGKQIAVYNNTGIHLIIANDLRSITRYKKKDTDYFSM
jgi:hypothetical protein